MRYSTLIVGMVSMLVAGCGGPADRNTAAVEGDVQAGSNAVNYQTEVASLPEGQRNAVFIRAIRDAQLECQHVESSTPAGEHQGMPVWNVRCGGGGNWTLVITADGTAQILNANEARLVGAEAGNSAGAAGTNAQ